MQGTCNIFPGLGKCSVWTPRPRNKNTYKDINSLPLPPRSDSN